jgi:hypothetical protein
MRKRLQTKDKIFKHHPPTQTQFDNLNNALIDEEENALIIEEKEENESNITMQQHDDEQIVGQDHNETQNIIDQLFSTIEDKNGLYWKTEEDENEDENEDETKSIDFEFTDSTADNLFEEELIDDYIVNFRNDAQYFVNGRFERNNADGDELFEKERINKTRTKSYTKSNFCKKFYAVSIKHNLSESAMWEILNVFDMCTEFLNLPLKQKITKRQQNKQYGDRDEEVVAVEEEDRSFPRTSIDIERFIDVDKSSLSIDICCKGCCAYLGNNATKIRCPICNEQRYSQCSQTSCRGKKYDHCKHNSSLRYPLRSMYYRSIIYVLTEKFINAIKKKDPYLNYLEKNIDNEKKSKNFTIIVDTIYSDPVREQYSLMCQYFYETLQPYCKYNHPNCKIEMKNFILSGFFDADTLFKRKGDSVWAYLISIHNCCPSDRMKLGKGLFLSIQHKEKLSTSSSQFLMDKVFVQELKVLERGVPIL